MKPEAQRIAIAEACGWTEVEACSCKEVPHGKAPRQEAFQHLPDYLNDLNAMHEAEKVLKGPTNDEHSQRAAYAEHLTFILTALEEPTDIWYWEHIHATPAQRAEAFLRTLGLWQEQPQEQTA
jgi:hypothetical protein